MKEIVYKVTVIATVVHLGLHYIGWFSMFLCAFMFLRIIPGDPAPFFGTWLVSMIAKYTLGFMVLVLRRQLRGE